MENRISGQALVDLKKEVSSFNAQLRQQQGRRAGENLDKDAFLRLLTIQISKQDPLAPMKNTEFVAQMAQFTALEQMKNMNTSIDTMKKNLAIIPGFSMIGKEVSYYDEASESHKSGRAESILLGNDGEPMVVVGKQKVSLENITAVKEMKASTKRPMLTKLPRMPAVTASTTGAERSAKLANDNPVSPLSEKILVEESVVKPHETNDTKAPLAYEANAKVRQVDLGEGTRKAVTPTAAQE